MSMRSTAQTTHPWLMPPLTFAAAYALQQHLPRHSCLHWSKVMPACTVALVASGSFIRLTVQNPSPAPQLRLVLLMQPPEPSMRLHRCVHRGWNPGRQLHCGDWPTSQYRNAPHLA
ncbi:hypothetical protein ZWY2020_040724 [Hordeum vulgare]|nr:hypothetical protein ZWY2020_040724 [Hordeum vulgare]